MSSIIDDTLDIINTNKYNTEHGISNCIPCPLPRFSEEFVGIEQTRYYIVTGSDKSSKTQFTNYLTVFNTLSYIKKNPNIDAQILYFALEESKDMIVTRYILYLLKVQYNVVCSYNDIMSIKTRIDPNIYNIITSDKFRKELDFFNQHVIITKQTEASAILQKCEAFALKYGKLNSSNRYVPNNKGLYKIVIIDHISLISPIQGKSLYETLRIFSHRVIEYRDFYNFTFVCVQQQNSSAESMEAKKSDEVMPAKDSLADYRSSINDCDAMIGIFNPTKVSKKTFKGYLMKDEISGQIVLGDRARFIKIMAQRRGAFGGVIGLYTDGPNAYFEELPRPGTPELNNLYNKLRMENNPPTVKPQTQTIFKSYMAKLLKSIKLTKTNKQYNIVWDEKDVPDVIEVDGNLLKRMKGFDGNTCKKCWLADKCNRSIPCTPTSYYYPTNIEQLKAEFGDVQIPGYEMVKGKLKKVTNKDDTKQSIGFKLNQRADS